ncbi:YecA/YgfB family protein [Endozoicomonadaceae bacterium StTr2]
MKHTEVPQDLETFLEDFLLSDRVDEEALDYLSAHGFMTALSISPVEVPQVQWMACLLNTEPKWESPEQKQQVEAALLEQLARIDREINEEETLELPCDPVLGKDPDESELRAWSFGFMEAVYLNEPAWFSDNEQEVSELLLPIMLASGLFDDEPEFKAMYKDKELVEDMCCQIPEVVTELYLLMRASAQ